MATSIGIGNGIPFRKNYYGSMPLEESNYLYDDLQVILYDSGENVTFKERVKIKNNK